MTFDGNGGLTEDGKSTVVMVIIVSDDMDIVAPVFTRKDYTFVGWDRELSAIKESCTVKAVWSEIGKETAVRFDSKGGSHCASIVLTKGREIPELPTPVWLNDEYLFAGWFHEGAEIIAGEIWTSDISEIIFTAVWRENYTDVTFTAKEGWNCVLRLIRGKEITSLPTPQYAADDYEFKGWYYLNGSEKIYVKEGDVWNVGQTEITLIADQRSLWTDFY